MYTHLDRSVYLSGALAPYILVDGTHQFKSMSYGVQMMEDINIDNVFLQGGPGKSIAEFEKKIISGNIDFPLRVKENGQLESGVGVLINCGQKALDFFNAKSVIQKQVNEAGGKSDLEAYMALEQLKKYEADIKEMMIYSGRPGMYQDFLAFQVQAAREREEVEKARVRAEIAKREKRLYYLMNVFWTACLFGLLYVLYWMGELVYLLTRGRS